MWVSRTAEEIERGSVATEREACASGRWAGIAAWLILVGIFAGVGMGKERQRVNLELTFGGTALSRGLIFGVLALPVAFWIYRWERQRVLRQAASRTLCPRCGNVGEQNAGALCLCGGVFVATQTIKWLEDE